MGAGLLRHDQHRHLRGRAGGAAAHPEDRPYDFSKEFFPLLLEMGRPMYGYVMDGYWQDIGNLDQFRQANFDALDEHVRLECLRDPHPGQRLGRRGRRPARSRRDRRAGVPRNYCRVAPDATVGPYSVLGTSVTLREARARQHSIVDASTSIGRSTSVEGAIVGRSLRSPSAHSRARGRRDRRRGHDRRRRALSCRAYGSIRTRRSRPARRSSRASSGSRAGRRASSGCEGVSGLVNVDLTPDVARAPGLRARDRAQTRRPSRRLTRGRRCLPDDQTRDDRGSRVDRRAVADLRVIPAAVARHLLKAEGFAAGIHVGISPNDPEAIRIQFFERRESR